MILKKKIFELMNFVNNSSHKVFWLIDAGRVVGGIVVIPGVLHVRGHHPLLAPVYTTLYYVLHLRLGSYGWDILIKS